LGCAASERVDPSVRTLPWRMRWPMLYAITTSL
jgi:hypothetical protein